MLLLSLAAVKHTHTLVLRCGGEDNTLTAPREGGGAERERWGIRQARVGGGGRRRRRRRASTCSTDVPWRDGGMQRRKMWPPTADASKPGHVYCPLETIRSVQATFNCCYCLQTLTLQRQRQEPTGTRLKCLQIK